PLVHQMLPAGDLLALGDGQLQEHPSRGPDGRIPGAVADDIHGVQAVEPGRFALTSLIRRKSVHADFSVRVTWILRCGRSCPLARSDTWYTPATGNEQSRTRNRNRTSWRGSANRNEARRR